MKEEYFGEVIVNEGGCRGVVHRGCLCLLEVELVLEPEEGVAVAVEGSAAERGGDGDAGGEGEVVRAASDGLAADSPDVLQAHGREGALEAQAGAVQNESLRHEHGAAGLLRDGESALNSAKELRVQVLLLEKGHVEAEDGAEHEGLWLGRAAAPQRVEAGGAAIPLYRQKIEDLDRGDVRVVKLASFSGARQGGGDGQG